MPNVETDSAIAIVHLGPSLFHPARRGHTHIHVLQCLVHTYTQSTGLLTVSYDTARNIEKPDFWMLEFTFVGSYIFQNY